MSFLSFVITYSFTRTARPFTKFSPPFLYLPSLWETIIANLKGHKFSFLFSPYKNQRNEGPKMKILFWSCTLWAFDPITKSKLNCWVKTQIKILNEVRMTKIWLTIFLFFFLSSHVLWIFLLFCLTWVLGVHDSSIYFLPFCWVISEV